MRIYHWTTKTFYRSTRVLGAIAIAAGVVTVGPAPANASCGPRATSQAFSRWGDYNQYFTAPNGNFDAATSGWSVVAGSAWSAAENEPWWVASSSRSSSLTMAPNTVVRSSWFCMASDEDSIRYFYKAGASGSFRVNVHAWSVAGASMSSSSIGVSSATGWRVSNRQWIPGVHDNYGQQWVMIEIETQSGRWQFDDIMVDPWRGR